MKKGIISGLIFFILVHCAKSENLKEIDLTYSVWILQSKKLDISGGLHDMKLKFDKNGYAYEQNTILKFPYKIHEQSRILELNHQNFEILSVTRNQIILKNVSSKLELNLIKE